jgi:cyclophilin family peptidyl-prolyl cis-trans isomerase
MNIFKAFAASLLLVFGLGLQASAADRLTILLKDGPVLIQLMPDVAPQHVKRIKELAQKGAYDNVAFHRVIDGFMAQTGDVQFGNMASGFQPDRAGTGGSDLPDLPAEFSNVPFERGVLGMARSQDPNSANSQFFIMFAPGDFLNGQYTVVGKVVSGIEFVDKIKRGDQDNNGSVTDPDRMLKVTVSK